MLTSSSPLCPPSSSIAFLLLLLFIPSPSHSISLSYPCATISPRSPCSACLPRHQLPQDKSFWWGRGTVVSRCSKGPQVTSADHEWGPWRLIPEGARRQSRRGWFPFLLGSRRWQSWVETSLTPANEDDTGISPPPPTHWVSGGTNGQESDALNIPWYESVVNSYYIQSGSNFCRKLLLHLRFTSRQILGAYSV